MPPTTPTTQELDALIIQQIEAALGQSVPLLPKAFVRVLAKVLAGVFILLWKYAGWIFFQVFVATAAFTDVVINGVTVNPLVAWGRLRGVLDPTPATNAELTVDVTVENQTGFLNAGAQLSTNKNGFVYITTADVALDAAVKSATVRAVSDPSGGGGGGVEGNLDNGDTLEFVNPLPNVARLTVVTSTVTAGADGETEAQYRQRVADAFAKPPQGGAYADYEAWAEEVAGIINAYPYSGDPAEVDVYSESSGPNSDGIPDASQLADVLASINQADRRPVTAFVNSLPITRTGFDVEVVGLTVTNETQVKQEIDAALGIYFANSEPFIDGLTPPPRSDSITVNAVISIVDDAVRARNGTFTTAILTVTGDPANPINRYVLNEGEKAKLGAVTYSA